MEFVIVTDTFVFEIRSWVLAPLELLIKWLSTHVYPYCHQSCGTAWLKEREIGSTVAFVFHFMGGVQNQLAKEHMHVCCNAPLGSPHVDWICRCVSPWYCPSLCTFSCLHQAWRSFDTAKKMQNWTNAWIVWTVGYFCSPVAASVVRRCRHFSSRLNWPPVPLVTNQAALELIT